MPKPLDAKLKKKQKTIHTDADVFSSIPNISPTVFTLMNNHFTGFG